MTRFAARHGLDVRLRHRPRMIAIARELASKRESTKFGGADMERSTSTPFRRRPALRRLHHSRRATLVLRIAKQTLARGRLLLVSPTEAPLQGRDATDEYGSPRWLLAGRLKRSSGGGLHRDHPLPQHRKRLFTNGPRIAAHVASARYRALGLFWTRPGCELLPVVSDAAYAPASARGSRSAACWREERAFAPETFCSSRPVVPGPPVVG